MSTKLIAIDRLGSEVWVTGSFQIFAARQNVLSVEGNCPAGGMSGGICPGGGMSRGMSNILVLSATAKFLVYLLGKGKQRGR